MSFLRRLLAKFGSKLLKLVKSYILVSLAVVILLSVLIWRYGPALTVGSYTPFGPAMHRVIAIAVVIFLWGVNNLFIQYKRAAPKPKPKPEVIVNPLKIKVQEFEKSFRGAMQIIKDNWLKESKFGNSFYSLPWYLVVGFAGAGKTSLIADSDLKFPLAHLFGQEDSRKIDPTINVDYWVTDDAILFDVSGELFTSPGSKIEEQSEIRQLEGPEAEVTKKTATREEIYSAIWRKFQTLLVSFRPRRPINGVVLCIDIVELLRWPDDERVKYAHILHSRLVELSASLGTRYTLHVVLTKLDLLEGFHSFFAGMKGSERGEPFGFTFEVYEETTGDVWLEKFQEMYKNFIDRINDQLLDRLANARSTTERQHMYLFSRQLAGLANVLQDYFSRALHQDSFSTAPLVRGVFFSSTRQEGVPFNPVLSTVASRYRLEQPIMPAHAGYSKPFFARNLLKHVVFKEAGLAGDNVKVEKSKHLALRGSILAASLGVLAVALFYLTASNDNIAKADETIEMARNFAEREIPQTGLVRHLKKNGRAGEQHLDALSAIDRARFVFKDHDKHSHALQYLALYQGKRIGPEIERAYIDVLQNSFLPAIAQEMTRRINDLGQREATRDSNERLDALRAYILLTDQSKRETREDLDGKQGAAEKWMQQIWQRNHEGKTDIQDMLHRHFSYALYDARLEVEPNVHLINTTQNILRAIPRDVRFYNSIKNLASRQLADDIILRNEIGSSYNIVFANTQSKVSPATHTGGELSIPSFFTKPSFHDFFVPKKEALSSFALEDAWVTGERETVDYSSEDLAFFKRRVSQRYTSEYKDAWAGALAQLEITDFEDINHGVRVLEELTGPNNPIGRLLELVKTHTVVYQSKPVDVEGKEVINTELAFDTDRENGLQISRAFARLNQITTPRAEEEDPYIEDLIAHLTNLYEYMKEIKQAGDRGGEVALAKAKDRIKLSGDDPIFILRKVAANLPAPLNRFVEKVADQSWKVVLGEAKIQLKHQWQVGVHDVFRATLKPRYPFTLGAREDVSLKDFENFFGPGGTIDNFFEENLEPFINSETGEPKTLDGQQLALRKSFVEELKKALSIRKYYFNNKGLLSVSFEIRPRKMSSQLSRSVLSLEGQIVPYTHGPRRPTTIIWPNSLTATTPSKLSSFSRNGTPFSSAYRGPWSTFRLLDRGKLTNIGEDRVDITFSVRGGSVTYVLNTSESENFFVTKPLANLKIPSEL